jgi:hypothetical protein
MKVSRIDRLLKDLQGFRIFSLLLQFVLIAASGWLSWSLFLAVKEKYLMEQAVLWGLTTAGVLLILLVHSLATFRSRNESSIAQRLDREYELKERISTYTELRSSNHPFLSALQLETERNLSSISVIQAAHIDRGTIAPLVVSLLLFVSFFLLPYLPVSPSIAERKAEAIRIQEQAKILENAIQKMQKETTQFPSLQKLLKEFKRISGELQKPGIDKIEALKKMNTMLERLQSLQKSLQESQQNALSQAVQKALRNSNATETSKNTYKQQLEQLAKELQNSFGGQNSLEGQEVKDAIQKGQLNKEQLEKMKRALEDYNRERVDSQKKLAEMQDALRNTQKGIASGRQKVTRDSKLNERDVDRSQGGVEDGPGTTNQDIGPHSFNTKKKGEGEYAEDRTKAKYEQIYKGEREEAKSEPLFLDSHWNESGDPKYTTIRSFGLSSDLTMNGSSPKITTQSTEESEIRKEKIPASFQEIVKEYFESIQEQ